MRRPLYNKLRFLLILIICNCAGQFNAFSTPYYRCVYLGSSYKICPDRKGNYLNGTITYNGKTIVEANINTFRVLQGRYAKDTANIYYEGRIIENADIKSFSTINNYYAKDHENVFFCDIIMSDLDIDTFEFISDFHIKDRYSVFFQEQKIDGANPQKFYQVEKTNYAKDDKSIFWREKKVEVADYETFEILDNTAAKDKNNFYYAGRIIDYIDPHSVKVYEYDSWYMSDKKNVYFILEPIKNIDISTFEYLGESYIKDKKKVFYRGKKVKGADAPTFELHNWQHGDAKDKNGYYRTGSKLEYDPLTIY